MTPRHWGGASDVMGFHGQISPRSTVGGSAVESPDASVNATLALVWRPRHKVRRGLCGGQLGLRRSTRASKARNMKPLRFASRSENGRRVLGQVSKRLRSRNRFVRYFTVWASRIPARYSGSFAFMSALMKKSSRSFTATVGSRAISLVANVANGISAADQPARRKVINVANGRQVR